MNISLQVTWPDGSATSASSITSPDNLEYNFDKLLDEIRVRMKSYFDRDFDENNS